MYYLRNHIHCFYHILIVRNKSVNAAHKGREENTPCFGYQQTGITGDHLRSCLPQKRKKMASSCLDQLLKALCNHSDRNIEYESKKNYYSIKLRGEGDRIKMCLIEKGRKKAKPAQLMWEFLNMAYKEVVLNRFFGDKKGEISNNQVKLWDRKCYHGRVVHEDGYCL